MTLIDLDVMNASFFEDVVEVHETIVDPDAVITLGHCIVCDAFAGHVLFDKNNL
jgi:hypothetical protein